MKRTPLRRVSRKRARENRERAKLRQVMGDACRVRWDAGCQGKALDLHEPLTRARGGSITDPENVVPVCRYCHDSIHANPREATERGWLVSRVRI